MARQGEVYWVDLGVPIGSAPGYRLPCVVIQSDRLNWSRIGTVMVCLLTSNVKLARAAGNVLLEKREGGLPKQSVVNVSQVFTVDRQQLATRIGTLSRRRVVQILEGLRSILEPVTESENYSVS